MYEELVKRLWECVSGECWNCSQHKDSYDGQRTCADNLMKQAADAIEELQQIANHNEEAAHDYWKDVCYYLERVPKWIPVTERVPKYGTSVLAYGSRGGIFVAKYERARAEWDRDYWWKLNSSIHVCNPTHWMPLPEPPESEE